MDKFDINTEFQKDIEKKKLLYQKNYDNYIKELNYKVSSDISQFDLFIQKWQLYFNNLFTSVDTIYKDDGLMYTGLTILIISMIILFVNSLYRKPSTNEYKLVIASEYNSYFKNIIDTILSKLKFNEVN
jgi:hypothetical protein